MAKTYIDTVKYLVYANVDIGGLVEKPDVVGAIFGQTEGLLGDELDLRDLQKNGRIGRIEVDLNGKEGRTIGIIKIPSSLDMVETCIIAAALETVDRVGPCEANIKIGKVEDTRNVKRKVLVDRAKGLLKTLINTELPESKEISEMVRDEVKTAEIVEYGYERLPAGPNVDKMNEVMLVEGRADVINLLKNDITNAVAIGGAKVPPTIVKLSKEKEITVFLDGDRGGDIILNELIQGGVEIDFIARAPTGKEVEELTRKEIIKCVRGRMPFEQETEGQNKREDRDARIKRKFDRAERREYNDIQDAIATEKITEKVAEIQPIIHEKMQEAKTLQVDKSTLIKELEELNNTLRARFYNSGYERVKEIAVRDVIKALEETRDVSAIVFDGIITQRLVDLAAHRGVKLLVGIKIGNVNKTPEGIEIITKSR
ncbi:DNA primase [Candidatus Micrarchaeota archaeon]|nr:DNA primase [Candidatus Micrarchaeota archaeon]